MKSKTFTREELYNLVWQKPLTHIAKELGYSDNGVRKVCLKHNIPLPKAGYWSKLKYNKKVTKTPLPKSKNETSEINFVIGDEIKKDGQQDEINQLKINIEESKELSLKVPEKLSKPDPLIVKTKEYFKELKIRKQKNDWRFVHNRNGIISINVSDPILPRALRFLDTLIKLLKKRGHHLVVDKHTKIVINDEEYKIRLTEKLKRIKNISDPSWPRYDFVPTGNLCLKFDGSYPVKEWTNTSTKPIEDKLAEILAWFEIRAKKDKIKRRQREIQRIKWKEEEKIQKERQKLKDDELSNFKTLFETATRWHKSQYLRNYIKEFESYTIKTDSLDDEKIEWIKWAKEKADWYDPFIEKEVELLKDIDRETLEKKYKKYW
ncbi:MAG: hypothetical protein WDZ45_12250 [Flavobacteriaceae bacterium]